jgi:hypothetical protein
MNAAAPPLRESRRRYWWLLIIFLLGVLVGWLLAPRCKSCGDSSPTAAAGGGAKLDDGSGDAKPGSAQPKDAPGAKTMGPDSGKRDPGYDAVGNKLKYADQPSPPADQHLQHQDGTGPDYNGTADPSGGKILKASDFRYDKTGLPRYAQAVSTTGSTLSHDIGSTAYHSTAAIITSSRFEDVVDWYKAQLPSGWNVQLVGNVGALAQQVSIGNILTALTAATQNKGETPGSALPDTAPTTASTSGQSANALSVAMFSPPPNSAGDPSIMIQQGTDHTVEITMSKNGTDQ